MEERRKHKRYGVKDSTVQVAQSGILAFLKEPAKPFLILNVSEGGLHFITRSELKEGEKVKLEIHAPKVTKAITLKSEVIWTRDTSQAGAFRVGVSFMNPSRQSADLLKHMLDTALMQKVDISTLMVLKHADRI